jgi:hypothetical protein
LMDTKPQPPEKPWKVDRKTRRAIVCLRFCYKFIYVA